MNLLINHAISYKTMPIRPSFTLFAENVLRDQTQKLSLINIFDKIQAEKLPVIQGRIVIIFGLHVSGNKTPAQMGSLHLFGYKPSGEVFINAELGLPADLEKSDSGEGNIVADLSGMPIDEYGEYKFALGFGEDKIISSRTLSVVTPPEQQGV